MALSEHSKTLFSVFLPVFSMYSLRQVRYTTLQKNLRLIGVCTHGLVIINHAKARHLYLDTLEAIVKLKASIMNGIDRLDAPGKTYDQLPEDMLCDIDEDEIMRVVRTPNDHEMFIAKHEEITLKDTDLRPLIDYNVNNDDLGICDMSLFDNASFMDVPSSQINQRLEDDTFSIHGGVDFDDDVEVVRHGSKGTPVYMEDAADNAGCHSNDSFDDDMYEDVFNQSDRSLPSLQEEVNVTPKTKRGRKRKPRMLIIDEQTQIPLTDLRRQMDDPSDTISSEGIVAPPSKRIMNIGEFGSMDYLNTNALTRGIAASSPVNMIYKAAIGKFATKIEKLHVESFENQQPEVDDNDNIMNWMTYAEEVSKRRPIKPWKYDENDDDNDDDMIDDVAAPWDEDIAEAADLLIHERGESPLVGTPAVKKPRLESCNSSTVSSNSEKATVQVRRDIYEAVKEKHFTIFEEYVESKVGTRKLASRMFMALLELAKEQKVGLSQTPGIRGIIVNLT